MSDETVWQGRVDYRDADGVLWHDFPVVSASTEEAAKQELRERAPEGADVISVSVAPFTLP